MRTPGAGVRGGPVVPRLPGPGPGGLVSEADRRRAGAVAVAGLRLAERAGVRLPDDLLIWELAGDSGDPRVGAAGASTGQPLSDPADLAGVLETATSVEERKAKGLHVTPNWLADELVGRAMETRPAGGLLTWVCDPACGGGAFLLAAARALNALGLSRHQIVEGCLWGADIDPVGLATAEAALAVWSGTKPPQGRLVVGDTLSSGADLWKDRPAPGFDAVVGNPPFLSQLASATVRSAANRKAVQDRFGAAVRPYTDTAWLFLLAGADLVRPGGRLALLQPVSIVAARDATGIREELLQRAVLRDLWVERERVFQAWVRVCCPILEMRDARQDEDTPGSGRTVGEPRALWADRLADGIGVPQVAPPAAGTVGDLADVGAGFRGEYYGLVPLVREAVDGEVGSAEGIRPLVTAGVLDWGRSAWGERSVRFARKRWRRPVVDVSRSPETHRSTSAAGKAATWLARTARPKVIVANQTRVVEPVVDSTGDWVPSVPALAVVPYDPADLWLLAAALGSPTATAWLLRRAPGTALARHALKIAASDLAALPLPSNRAAWEDAASALRAFVAADGAASGGGPSATNAGAGKARESSFDAYCRAIGEAYGVPPDVEAWWRDRRSRYLRQHS